MHVSSLLVILLPFLAAAAPVEPRQRGNLQVYIASASCLRSEDTVTRTDPYLTISYNGGAAQRTATKSGTKLVEFDETMDFSSSSSSSSSSSRTLKIVAKDSDVVRDDTIGRATVDLNSVDTSRPITVELKHLAGLRFAGVVTLMVTE
ncbi:C2 domain-containing protein [Phlyctochytrium arcticum]|nr:C2 domain-containing protein [Phlyctochytrium arcticum]